MKIVVPIDTWVEPLINCELCIAGGNDKDGGDCQFVNGVALVMKLYNWTIEDAKKSGWTEHDCLCKTCRENLNCS